jgi:Ca-activated chloride channel family protein
VVLSDGEDHGGGLDERIARLKDAGVVVHAFGIGTTEGARIPIPGTQDLKRDADGNLVTTRLHEETLESLARSTGGEYLRATSAAIDPSPVLRQIDRMEKRTIESQTLSTREERFQWPLGLSALALVLYLTVSAFAPVRPARRASS